MYGVRASLLDRHALSQVPRLVDLATASCSQVPVMESKRQADGRWKMQTSLNGKMLANVEKKGATSSPQVYRSRQVSRGLTEKLDCVAGPCKSRGCSGSGFAR